MSVLRKKKFDSDDFEMEIKRYIFENRKKDENYLTEFISAQLTRKMQMKAKTRRRKRKMRKKKLTWLVSLRCLSLWMVLTSF